MYAAVNDEVESIIALNIELAVCSATFLYIESMRRKQLYEKENAPKIEGEKNENSNNFQIKFLGFNCSVAIEKRGEKALLAACVLTLATDSIVISVSILCSTCVTFVVLTSI